jgi:hypothetical protein
LFAFFCVPETKGLSLEQIDLLYRESSIIKSNSYRRELLEREDGFDGRSRMDKEAKLGGPSHINDNSPNASTPPAL